MIQRSACILGLVLRAVVPVAPGALGDEPFYRPPDVPALAGTGMRDVIERWRVDRDALRRFFGLEGSPTRRARLREFGQAWLEELQRVDYGALPRAQQVDWHLLRGELLHELGELDLEQRRWEEMAELLPFAEGIAALQEARQLFEELEPQEAASRIARLAEEVEALSERVRAEGDEQSPPGDQEETPPIRAGRIVAERAASAVGRLKEELDDWYRFRAGYDPLFTWWVEEPWKALDGVLERYREHLHSEVAGLEEDDGDTIVGDPIGREALLAELEHERIPYAPEELVAIADAEMAWCEERMREAARELGYGDDWRSALEHVKALHVEPGGQPRLVRELAEETIAFLEQRDLLTIPDLAKRTWRMEMMSPERQKLNPFFLGGETITVSFPTDSMAHEDKLMSLRANNVHFSRATVHHELIPGHHLQQFMQSRHAAHRRPFGTPFWTEGWALYWEMRLWDLGFPRSDEDRVGMLFWRMHRCARIRFSLAFQLGEMTPQECVELLVERVGHERRSAEGEVRRSVQGGYGPLYQCAYMLGGLQLLALQRELVVSGGMSERDFHDAVLRENSIPIELLRAALEGVPLPPDDEPAWLFYEGLRR